MSSTEIPRSICRRAWIEAWDLEDQVAGRDRWLLNRDGPPDVMVHPGTGTVHVLGRIRGQKHGHLTFGEFATWPGVLGARALEHVVRYGWERALYGRLREADDLCGLDVMFLCRHVGPQWASCGIEVPRDASMGLPHMDARVCGLCVRRTPGWSADGLRERARTTHDQRVTADVAAVAMVAANLGVSP